jgi:hypothetical protein
MKFECGDLERALANPALMADAQQHMRDCAICRNEYRIWNEISSAAKQLHCEWESPDLWPNIRRGLEAQSQTPKRRWPRTDWKLWVLTAAAAAIVFLVIMRWPQTPTLPPTNGKLELATLTDRDFLTEKALREAERNETAYRRSIDELSRLAQPKLENPASSPLMVSYREKLLMLDSAILETRSNIAQNRFNVRLQSDLADLYREKRQTLQEVLTRDQRN